MARDPGKLSDRPWSGEVEVAAADALEGTSVRRALEGVDVAYYLIHSLGTGASFEQRDRDAAGIFADAARSAGVTRIVYLGGMVSGDGGGLSPIQLTPRLPCPIPPLEHHLVPRSRCPSFCRARSLTAITGWCGEACLSGVLASADVWC
jgi:nucleoside-diphosphate-sugar epimerase